MLKEHYEQVLEQLRTDVEVLAKQYPDLAVNLQRQNTDPDVARLLEGVSMIAARQRQQLEEDLEEQAQGWLQSVAPDLLKPVPSMALACLNDIASVQTVAAGTQLTSASADHRIDWQVATPTRLLPVSLQDVVQSAKQLSFEFAVSSEFTLNDSPLTLQMTENTPANVQLVRDILDRVDAVVLKQGEQQIRLSKQAVQLKNIVQEGSWLAALHDRFDQPTVPSWLRELWCYPLRALAITIDAQETSSFKVSTTNLLSVSFVMKQPLSLSTQLNQWCVNTVPLVNFKASTLLPFTRQKDKTLYELAMMSELETTEQIVSLTAVNETIGKSSRSFTALHALAREDNPEAAYQLIRQTTQPNLQIRLDATGDDAGLVKVNALIHQGDLASELPSGTEVAGSIGSGYLLSSPTAWQAAPETQAAQWQAWQTHQAANLQTDLHSVKAQLTLLCPSAETHYESNRKVSRAIEALTGVTLKDSPITRGTSLVLGQELSLTYDFSALPKEDAWLFNAQVWQWMRSRLPINSVLSMRVFNEKQEPVFRWRHASGTRTVV